MKLALILFGGAAGSLLRHFVQELARFLSPTGFPFGTLAVNVIGCFAIGALQFWFAGPCPIRADYRLGLITGLLGGFTTFSAFGWETFSLAEQGHAVRAIANVVLSVALGLFAVWIGYRLAERWWGAA